MGAKCEPPMEEPRGGDESALKICPFASFPDHREVRQLKKSKPTGEEGEGREVVQEQPGGC